MEKNKTGKYLKYAIGEIILVVIGILIALQINNWNENQKLEIIKQNYLQLLFEDLEEESININSSVSFSNEIIASYEAYEEKFNKSNMSLREISNALSTIESTTITPIFKTNTTETLKSTGDIKLIPTEIREKIIELSRSQEYLDHVIKRNINIYLEQMRELGKLGWNNSKRLRTNTNITRVRNSRMNDEEIYKLIVGVESVYAFNYIAHNKYIKKYEIMLKDIAHIKKLIELELN